MSRVKELPHVIKQGGGRKAIVVGVSQKEADKKERLREEAELKATAEKVKEDALAAAVKLKEEAVAAAAKAADREKELPNGGSSQDAVLAAEAAVHDQALEDAAAKLAAEEAAGGAPAVLPKPNTGIDRPEKRGRFNSFVGTVEYMAPEIISGVGHSYTVDFWIFGVMLYEMLYGVTAFRGADAQQTFSNITTAEVIFPELPGELPGGAVVPDAEEDEPEEGGEEICLSAATKREGGWRSS